MASGPLTYGAPAIKVICCLYKTTDCAAMRISEALVCHSVGIDDADDLIADLSQALASLPTA